MKAKPQPPRLPKYKSKGEEEYAQHLSILGAAGEIQGWRYEAIKLRLADGAWYTPDFIVLRENCIEIHEFKGFWREAARVRIKVAAETYPEFQFIAIQRQGNGWKYEEFK